MLDTLCKKGECPTSKQQLELFEIIKNKYSFVELNYPYSSCVLDIYICINNIKIDIEYDGWYWHQDQQRDNHPSVAHPYDRGSAPSPSRRGL